MLKLNNIYRKRLREQDGVEIWLVDGAAVRRELFVDFVMGGHDGRYKFIPAGEIWIDNSLSLEDLEYTIAHEIHERERMVNAGLDYSTAHDEAVDIEHKMRLADRKAAEEKELETEAVELGTYLYYGKEGED